jgi:hypothetical protein
MRAIVYLVITVVLGLLASCGGSVVVQDDASDQPREVSGGPERAAVDPMYVFYNSEGDTLE